MSSWHDVEVAHAEARIYFEEASRIEEAKGALRSALEVLAAADDAFSAPEVFHEEIADEDWRYSYRRHFKTMRIGERLIVRPEWEEKPSDGVVLTLDPGLSFGTGGHETTRACLEYIDALASEKRSMLDMGCGSGILSIAASLLGCKDVAGFDVDADAVASSRENAAKNDAEVRYFVHALGGAKTDENGDAVPSGDRRNSGTGKIEPADIVAANILGPLLIRYADEIAPYAKEYLIISGILNELYEQVKEEFVTRGFTEAGRKTLGEWSTGLLKRKTP